MAARESHSRGVEAQSAALNLGFDWVIAALAACGLGSVGGGASNSEDGRATVRPIAIKKVKQDSPSVQGGQISFSRPRKQKMGSV